MIFSLFSRLTLAAAGQDLRPADGGTIVSFPQTPTGFRRQPGNRTAGSSCGNLLFPRQYRPAAESESATGNRSVTEVGALSASQPAYRRKDGPVPGHAPADYRCPFCLLAAGLVSEHVSSCPEDIVYQDQQVMAFINARQWPTNRGHVLVVPVSHYENIYTLPVSMGARIHELTRMIAIAMKHAYGCDGISTRQHNEPAGSQEVWHFHQHVFPRYDGDDFYTVLKGTTMLPTERARYARRLRAALAKTAGPVGPDHPWPPIRDLHRQAQTIPDP